MHYVQSSGRWNAPLHGFFQVIHLPAKQKLGAVQQVFINPIGTATARQRSETKSAPASAPEAQSHCTAIARQWRPSFTGRARASSARKPNPGDGSVRTREPSDPGSTIPLARPPPSGARRPNPGVFAGADGAVPVGCGPLPGSGIVLRDGSVRCGRLGFRFRALPAGIGPEHLRTPLRNNRSVREMRLWYLFRSSSQRAGKPLCLFRASWQACLVLLRLQVIRTARRESFAALDTL